ncbi:hypothetical protein OTB20_36770 [Streptomyces sp. H27-H1]|uniref:hypothetical protein n=1 Tax=Streptomyces sp. H27-H1 TaxID=2996461 RepID=UPI00226FC1C6|nr:hypothetical protein [Streptomyces sp. H27-H1]MCY0931640.1 hypothetical protein [Streptomyces sp. H27-H1]
MPNGYSWLGAAGTPKIMSEKETPPKTIKQITMGDPAWRTVFGHWLASQDLGAAERYYTLTAEHRTAKKYGKWFETAAEERGWNLLVKKFLTNLPAARSEWKAFEAGCKKVGGDSRSNSPVARAELFRSWAAGEVWKEDGSDSPPSPQEIAVVEAWIVAHTREVKPKFSVLYGAFGALETQVGYGANKKAVRMDVSATWTGVKDARTHLETAYLKVTSAEGYLRQLCRPHPDKKLDGASCADELREAHVALINAYAGLAHAVTEAARSCYAWAQATTRDQLRDNFSSNFRVINGVLLGMEGLIAGMRVCLAIVGAAGGLLPVTAIASAALAVASDSIQELVRRAVAGEAAKDPRQVREHVGREYQDDPANKVLGSGTQKAADTAADCLSKAASLTAAVLRSNVLPVTAAKALPLVGEATAVGTFLVRLHDHFNRKVLTDRVNRSHLLEMFDEASRHVDGAQLGQCSVVVHSFDPDNLSAVVDINGVRGTLAQGRFRAKDRRDVFRTVAERWIRQCKDHEPVLSHSDGDLLVMAADLQRPATAEDLLDPNCADFKEVGGGGYLICARAIQFARGVYGGSSLWLVQFAVSVTGTAGSPCMVGWERLSICTPLGRTITTTDQFTAETLLENADAGSLERFDRECDEYGWTGATFETFQEGGDVKLRDEQGTTLINMKGEPAVLQVNEPGYDSEEFIII